MNQTVIERIAKETGVLAEVVSKVAALLDEGNTIPFLARYRKEVTGGLDEVALASIQDRMHYYQELTERKQTILQTIEKQGKLTDLLKKKIEETFERFELEDIYLPYKPKRRTRAQVARELGLEPFAERILAQTDNLGITEKITQEYQKALDIQTSEETLKGALDIVAEKIAETPEIRKNVRDLMWREGLIKTTLLADKDESKGKYDEFDAYSEPVNKIPSHRILRILRGAKEKELSFSIEVDEHEAFLLLDDEVITNKNCIWEHEIKKTIRDAYDRLLKPQIDTEIRQALKEKADIVAVQVFADNVRQLLLAPPLKGKTVLALDPGYRTGAKLSVIDKTGKLLAFDTVFPTPPKNDVDGTLKAFEKYYTEYAFEAFAIGNGTGGRETMKVAKKFAKEKKLTDSVPLVMVNESGASVYSASEIAREEFPELDLTIRGAISIGRRLQDPLAELVKIDPKSIGVGQYQHDVDQKLLDKKLNDVVEYCVNHVGVSLNTASAPLLSRVAGLTKSVAKNIVKHRNEHGAFNNRKALLNVLRFGEKTFEQAAGFLRVEGDEPLDNSAVHPERYELVRQMAKDLGIEVAELIGNPEAVARIDKANYISDDIGEYTLDDILKELAKPGLDPRDDFTSPEFHDEINEITDLEEGMALEGVVTNVTKFGVFVDIGVHQDGMVHVSELEHRFVSDPAEVAKVGEKMRVKVIEVDVEKKRIGLSKKALLEPPKREPRQEKPRRDERRVADTRTDKKRFDGKPPKKGGKKTGNQKREQKPQRDVIASGRMADLLKAALSNDEE